jgi:hypothetical protein|tara:strand:+ start:495 stop:968 length:474 start_codon:yes stop_codon:yes gene_type:complete
MAKRTSEIKKPKLTKGKEFTSLPFVLYVMSKCKKFNVNFLISPDSIVIRGGEPCDGFFEASEKGESGFLVVCTGKDLSEVLHTLAHEFSHLMQWYEDDPLYLAWDKRDSEENSLKLEIDAERRALLLLNEWDIFDEKAQERSDKYIRTLKGENDANV